MFSGTTDKDKKATVGPVLVVVLFGKKKFLGERTRRRGVWWVIPLGVKETELLVGILGI